MNKNKIFRSAFLLFILVSLAPVSVLSQDVVNDFQTRTAVKISIKPMQHLKVNFTPELRFNNNLQFDQYLFEGEVIYQPFKIINVGTSYRFTGNKTGSGDYKNRNTYALFLEAEKKLKRFTPSLKMTYTNSADDENNSRFLRYKAGIDYNIRKSKLTPELSVEAFQDLVENNLYKMRYSAGLNYKIFKNNSIGVDYKLDYYLTAYRNKHIVSIAYKIKF